jgi:hypothetical protein
MWYDSCMPKKPDTDIVTEAKAAVSHAQRVRRSHARRTDRNSKQRAKDVEMALDRLREAMRPIRSGIAKYAVGPQTEDRRQVYYLYRDLSEAIQKERRKLWKMCPREALA